MGELLVVYDDILRRSMRRQRIFRDRTNPLELFDDVELIEKFRFPRPSILQILSLIEEKLSRPTKRSNPLSPLTQLLVTLRFYGKGLFQIDNGDTAQISQPSVSRCITSVTNALCSLRETYIRFPKTSEELNNVKAGFYSLKGFPNIIGAVDGSHIRLQPPPGDEEKLYVCRKGGHSINVQFVGNADMKILDVVAMWPGSAHDAFIWNNCQLRASFIANTPNGWLLGDSGYPLEPWVLTPYLEPNSHGETTYNKAHKSTRRIIENTIGLLKSVFRCLDLTGGFLVYAPAKVCKLVVACSILHNIRRDLRLEEDENFQAPEITDEPQFHPRAASENYILKQGELERKRLIQNVFSK